MNQSTLSNQEKQTSETFTPTFAIVVGEHSGDTLGAGLMVALRGQYPNAKFIGIGGPKMLALGFQSLFDMEELAVMGIVEVLGRIRRLLYVRKSLTQYFTENIPDVFIGIDAPDFNIGLEARLKAKAIKTVHYVSPSVWAWREKRVFTIAKATDMVLSLLPFEKAFYDKHQVPCTFVGHPLADDIPMESDKVSARNELGLALDNKVLALMPGSRGGELSRLLAPFLLCAEQLYKEDSSLTFVAPMISEKRAEQFNALKSELAPNLPVNVIINQTQTVMAASDCLLTASGTVTLEAALIKRPMVICYKFSPITYLLAKWLVKLQWFSLPNLLANKSLVPELLQDEVCLEKMFPLVKERLYQDQSDLNESFKAIHQQLRCNASEQAAKAIVQLMPKVSLEDNHDKD
ncbi:lipid-A-disaccharide synthase [Litorilituus lipolyticus]|uniref:Lipid-A-disaccharide synthase n=1 Tax=Litorilituus lipolyticus TaxID=2491017 RepID=A0A502KRQ8_9GAMM|nr:lipid-A-disaccharide synthase [Litorilituus lipolyticus]TPH13864.1 lipid-A-disaccharide synthase [Litorilituus lipolyticus]